MTTDSRRRGLPRFSVRTRIAVVSAVLTAVAMAGAGLLVYLLESARIERDVHRQIDQEIAEFRALRIDPETGEPFVDAGRLLNVFLTRNVPDDDEMLIGYVEGQRPERTRNRYGEEVLDHPTYEAALAGLLEDGGTREISVTGLGEVWVSVVPVRNTASTGALAIVNFLEDEHSELNRTMRTYSIVALLSLGAITALAGYTSGRLLAPLRTLEETAREITATDLTRRIPERGSDDITALTQTFNLMLERLEAGFGAQRQFLDDAGHELRTPLTVLSGHLEVFDPTDPEEATETRELLLDEVDRMSRLVEDLILLAKSRRPDFVRSAPVDLDALTRSVLAKARGLGDRVWHLDAVAHGTALLDEQRITQALLQLAENAVKHTSAGEVVAIGSAHDDATVSFWVRDTGDGVPAADRERIFERFGRSSVRSGDEGFGLGLSVVAAIATAHEGSVHVEDAAPRGSRFVLILTSQEGRWPAS